MVVAGHGVDVQRVDRVRADAGRRLIVVGRVVPDVVVGQHRALAARAVDAVQPVGSDDVVHDNRAVPGIVAHADAVGDDRVVDEGRARAGGEPVVGVVANDVVVDEGDRTVPERDTDVARLQPAVENLRLGAGVAEDARAAGQAAAVDRAQDREALQLGVVADGIPDCRTHVAGIAAAVDD